MDDDGDGGRACEELSDGFVNWVGLLLPPQRMYVVLSLGSFVIVSKF